MYVHFVSAFSVREHYETDTKMFIHNGQQCYNKTVLLCDRDRHTACWVANTSSPVLSRAGEGGEYPHLGQGLQSLLSGEGCMRDLRHG